MITYSHESFIAEAIHGVLMQECDFDVELIIADDCSPDNTNRIIDSFRSHPNFGWIKYTKHELNKGVNDNFIWAVGQAKGRYIAMCEGDDYWVDPHKLQIQVDFLEANENCGLIYSDYQMKVDNELIESQKIGRSFLNLNEYFSAGLPFIFTGSWLLRNKISDLKLFSEKFGNLPGDVQVVCHVLNKGYAVQFIDNEMGIYRILEESASHSKIYDKDKDFSRVRWLLVNKYKSNLSKKIYKTVLTELIQKKFQYIQSFRLSMFDRLDFFLITYKTKGLHRALRFLLLNVTK
jgi:glycosyltransferase involved in cell wall biosynthesis